MNRNKISKKSPCPCGSGKKYKKCCYQKDIVFQRDTDPDLVELIQDYQEMDGTYPLFNDTFFVENSPNELSAHNVMFNIMRTGGLDVMLSTEIPDQDPEGKTSFKLIEQAESAESLVDLMKGNVNPVAYPAILNKCMTLKNSVIPLVLHELKEPQVSMFTELSTFILYMDGSDYSEAVLEILKQSKTGVYGASLLCLLLGFYDNQSARDILIRFWNFYCEKTPEQNFKDGPFIALRELHLKQKSKLAGTVLA